MWGKLRPGTRRRPIVLVADDDDDTRELYLSALPRFGFDVIGGSNTIEALGRVPYVLPHIIVTEVTSQHGDPWNEIHSIQTDARTRNIPIVIVTEDSDTAVRQRSERHRCAAFFVKPCSPEGLAATLQQILDMHDWLERVSGP
jgi:chemosensory pili system protein ChpA (sensor histidine kinase/response regulator)